MPSCALPMPQKNGGNAIGTLVNPAPTFRQTSAVGMLPSQKAPLSYRHGDDYDLRDSTYMEPLPVPALNTAARPCYLPTTVPRLSSMRNCEHPAYQSVGHKLRRFAGALAIFSREHHVEDGLREIAREALDEAVDYANKPSTEAQVQRSKRVGTPEGVGRLVMTFCHVRRNHTPAAYEWLCRASLVRSLTSLLFAVGVRARTSLYARRFVAGWHGDPTLALPVLPDECGILLDSFREASW